MQKRTAIKALIINICLLMGFLFVTTFASGCFSATTSRYSTYSGRQIVLVQHTRTRRCYYRRVCGSGWCVRRLRCITY